MICAPFCSGSTGVFREQLLVIVDSACYAVCAIAAVALTPKTDDTRSAVGCTAIYFAVCITSSWYRHVRHACAACNHNEKPSGTARIPPVNLTNAAAVKPLTFMHVAPVIVMWVGVFWLYASRDAPAMNPCVVAVLLVASELHVWMSRGHGDHSGGKHVPAQFALMIHLVASMSGTPPDVALSLHRVFIVFTYFVTGFRKMYCTGLRWADGYNLQLMLACQGLYHDLDTTNGMGFNFALAEYRLLCFLGSAGVLGLQLAMPIFLLLDAKWPEHGILIFAFWIAMSFHAGNHVLWRINFFGSWCPALVSLLLPAKQLSPSELWQSLVYDDGYSSVPICCLFLVYFTMQFGHALDELSEAIARRCQRWLESNQSIHWFPKSIGLALIACFQFHLLGDYYTDYWLDKHPPEKVRIACVIVKEKDGSESLVPAATDFYFRRHLNGWIEWPTQFEQGKEATTMCRIVRKASPGSGAIGDPPGPPAFEMPLSQVLQRLSAHLHFSYATDAILSRIRKDGCECVLRVRGLAYHGTALRVHRLWECPMPLVRRD